MSKFEYQAKVMASSVYFTPEDFKVLSKLRIIQKNLVHVQGFPDSLADKSLLSQPEYFGQFGKILICFCCGDNSFKFFFHNILLLAIIIAIICSMSRIYCQNVLKI